MADLAADIRTVLNFSSTLKDFIQATQGLNLGPFNIDVNCSHGLFGIYTEHFTCVINFNQITVPLVSIVNEALAQADSFADEVSLLEQWSASAHSINDELIAAIKAQHALDEALMQPLTPPVFQGVRESFEAVLAEIIVHLQQSAQQLFVVQKKLIAFLHAQQNSLNSVRGVQANLNAGIARATTDVNAFIESQPCGGSDGYDQFSGATAVLQASVEALAGAVSTLTQRNEEANHALQELIGIVVNYSDVYSPVLTQLQAAEQAEYHQYVQLLHLDIAGKEWADMAAVSF